MSTASDEPGVDTFQKPRLAVANQKSWWLIALRGVVAILFGLFALMSPAVTILALVLFWAVYAIADGILALFAAIGGGGTMGQRSWLAVIGVAGIAAGGIAIVFPLLAAGTLVLIMGWWAILVGATEIWAGISRRKEIDSEWSLIIGGLLALAAGVWILARPVAGAFALVWVLGLYALFAGAFFIMLAIRVKRSGGSGLA